MPKLPDDTVTAYDYVKDVLGVATSICVSILDKEEKNNSPDRHIIDKYETELKKIFYIKRELAPSNPQRMQEIYDEYNQFIKDHP